MLELIISTYNAIVVVVIYSFTIVAHFIPAVNHFSLTCNNLTICFYALYKLN